MKREERPETFRDLHEQERRYQETKGRDKHTRAKPYKRDKKRVDYANTDEEDFRSQYRIRSART